MRGVQNLSIAGPGKEDASRPGTKPISDITMLEPSLDASRRNASPTGALPASDVSMQGAGEPTAQAHTRGSQWQSWRETRQTEISKSKTVESETSESAEKEQWHNAEGESQAQIEQAQVDKAQGDKARLRPLREEDDSDDDSDSDGDERFVDFEDPETRDEIGNLDMLKAVVVGRLAWRGRMIVQLPSNNLRHSGYAQRYM